MMHRTENDISAVSPGGIVPGLFLQVEQKAGEIAITKKKRATFAARFSAEREGFEPPVPLSTAVFKTAVIDHSTTFPMPNM